MKINKPIGTPLVNPYAQKSYATNVKQVAGAKRDELQISAEAKLMLEEEQALTKSEREKVDKLKAAIQDGTYQVDNRKVAEKLYEFWFDK